MNQDTYTVPYGDFVSKLLKPDTPEMQVLHGALGLAGEAGELVDAIKKNIIYGHELDEKLLDNIEEEIGDVLFYLQAICNHYGISPAQAIVANRIKLSKRYEKLAFSKEESIARKDKEE